MSSFPGAYEYNRGYAEGKRHGAEDERARIRAGLIALDWDINTGMEFGLSDVLAVIDAPPQGGV